MVLDATNGGQLDASPFDLDLNNQVNQEDWALYDGKLQPVSGRQPDSEVVGVIGRPAFVSTGSLLLPNLCGTAGECDQIPQNPMEKPFSRESWRQLQ
jgi:hypothetical protein